MDSFIFYDYKQNVIKIIHLDRSFMNLYPYCVLEDSRKRKVMRIKDSLDSVVRDCTLIGEL